MDARMGEARQEAQETLAQRKVTGWEEGGGGASWAAHEGSSSLSKAQPICELALISSFRHSLGVISYNSLRADGL